MEMQLLQEQEQELQQEQTQTQEQELQQDKSLNDLLFELHKTREQSTLTKTTIELAENDFRAHNAHLYESANELRLTESKLRDEIMALAIKEYERTGVKKVHDAVTVTVMTALHYDSEAALMWSKEHGMCLALDKKSFDSLCKDEKNRPEFVGVSDIEGVRISQDLSKFFGDGDKVEDLN